MYAFVEISTSSAYLLVNQMRDKAGSVDAHGLVIPLVPAPEVNDQALEHQLAVLRELRA